jgi:uncharacterized integral membrane protein
MASHDREQRVSGREILRPVLVIGTIAAMLVLIFVVSTSPESATPSEFDWRLGLLFLGCTAAIIAFQAFFVQYFAVKSQKRALLAAIERDQSADERLLRALSERTGMPVEPSGQDASLRTPS